MNDAHRDPIVARALRDLPVPDHGPGFWDAVGARLATEPVDDDAGEPGSGRVDTGELPTVAQLRPAPAPPPRHRTRFLAVAAALAVMAVTAGLLLRDGGSGPAGEQAATTLAPAASAPPAGQEPFTGPSAAVELPELPTLTTSVAAAATTPSDAVVAFVDALGAGALADARDVLGPRTQHYLTATGVDLDDVLVEMAEGYGAWASSTDRRLHEVAVPGAGTVVVLQGTRTAEGMVEEAVHALPTVAGEHGWVVEPMAYSPSHGGGIEVHVPAPGPGGWSGTTPEVAFQVSAAGAERFWFSLDGHPPVGDDDGAYDPPGELATGTHLLVVVAVGAEVFTAAAGTFVVEG